MNLLRLAQVRTRTSYRTFFALIFLLALLLASCQQTSPSSFEASGEEPALSAVTGSKALVICPPTDSEGCNRIAEQLALTSNDTTLVFSGGVDTAYESLRSMPLAELQQYSVVFVPSLANASYDLLREDTVKTRLEQILGGRVAIWSGTPDRGTTSGASGGKLTLIQNLARWAAAGYTTNGSTGLVVLQDSSDANADDASPRYDWVQGIASVKVEPDTTARSYDQVEQNTGNPAAESIVGTLAYDGMASFGLVLPQPVAEIGAWGQRVRGNRTSRGSIVLGTVMRSPVACESVGPTGGEFAYQAGNVVLDFPAGALSEDWCVSVEQASAEGAGYVQNTAYSFGPSGLSFATPAVLTIAYDENDIPEGGSESDLAIHAFTAGAWAEVPGSVVDAEGNTVTTPSFAQPIQHAIFLKGLAPPPSGGGKPVAGVVVAPISGSVAAGALQTLTTTVTDKQGKPLAGRIVAWSSTNGGTFSTTTGTTDTNGESVTDFTAATLAATEHVVTVTVDTETGTSALTVIAGPASQLAFTVQPTGAQAGMQFSPAVQVTARDDYGNTVTDWVSDVTLTITTDTGTPGATLDDVAAVTAIAGVATFTDRSIATAGTGYTLTATSESLSVISDAFDITPGNAAQLAFTVQPTNTTAGGSIAPAPQVQVQDTYGNLVPTASVDITLAVTDGTGTSGAALTGATTLASTDGVVTFTDQSITTAGTGYTLTATSADLTDATSSTFDITPAAAASLTVAPSTATIDAGATQLFTATVADAYGNVIENASVDWSSSDTDLVTVSPTTGSSTTAAAASTVTANTDVTITATTLDDITGQATLTVNPVVSTCDDAGWILSLTGPTEEPFYAQASTFAAAWTHGSANPDCGAAPATVTYAWTMNDQPLSSSATAEIAALAYAGGIYLASNAETVVALTATVDTAPAVTAERILRPRPTTPTGTVVMHELLTACLITYCDIVNHAVSENPDGDDEALVFEWRCSTFGATHGVTYCNPTFVSGEDVSGADYFPADQTGPTSLLSGRVGVDYIIEFRVRKTYDDQWSEWTKSGNAQTYPQCPGCYTVRLSVTSLAVHQGDQSIEVGETFGYTATVTTSEPTASLDVTWSSSNESVATVAPDGTVTGVSNGTAQITSTSVFDPTVSDTVTLTVASVAILEGDQSIEVGATFAYTAPVDVAWSSSNSGVAAIAADGTVTGVGVGTAQITATSTFDSGNRSSVTVTVTETSTVTGVSIVEGDQSIEVGATLDYTASVTTTGTAGRDVVWSSDNQSVATVAADGTVTGVAVGTAQITATSTFDPNISGSVTLSVTQGSVTTILINEGDQGIEVGDTFSYTITATGSTTGIPSTDVTWSSNAEGVATVTPDGTVMGVAVGVAQITATSTFDTNISDTVTVTVTATSTVTSVSINEGNRSIGVGDTFPYTATVATTGTASTEVTWSSGNEGVATVATDGTVTGVATGVALITAVSTFDPSVSSAVTVTVTSAACDDAGWRVDVMGPAGEPFFAQASTFAAAWTHASGDPVCGAPTVAVTYAWTMSGQPLSSSATAEIAALGYAGGIYLASKVETIVGLTATVDTAPAVTAERILRPRSTTPMAFTANQVQSADCQDTYCEVTTYPVFYNPDGDDEALVFEYRCSASGVVGGVTYCNDEFSSNADYFPPGQTGPTALLNGRVGIQYTIRSRVRKAYEDPADPASWSRFVSSGYITYYNGSIVPNYGAVIRTGTPSFVINEGDRSIGVGGTISYTISASDFDEYGFRWSSDDVSSCDNKTADWQYAYFLCGEGNEIATVGTDGTVTGVAEGMVLITARSKQYDGTGYEGMYRYSVLVAVTND